jgi:protease I
MAERLRGKKIGILLESDFYEHEIFYYQLRFPEEGAELHFMTRLWGQPSLTFTGHEYKIPMTVNETFEGMSDEELRSYSAIIVPSAMVSDRLRYTEDIGKLPPATLFMQRAFAEPNIVKGIICHGMWLVSPIPEVVRGRRVTCHNNLVGDIRNMGARYTDQHVVVDGDLITGRSASHCHLFARTVIDMVAARSARSGPRRWWPAERIAPVGARYA